MKRLIYIIQLFLFLSFITYSQEGWHWQNPFPQGNELKAATSTGTLWVVGTLGTVMHFSGINDRWENVDVRTNETLNDIYVELLTGKGWIVGNNGLILYTEDNGETWTQQNSGSIENLFAVSGTTDEACVWVCGAKGTILKTSDDGRTWENKNVWFDLNLYDIDHFHCNEAWAAGEDGVIINTTDGGDTWKSHATPTPSDLFSISITDYGGFRACGRYGVIIASMDKGESWQKENELLNYDLRGVKVVDIYGSSYSVGNLGKILEKDNNESEWIIKETGIAYALNTIGHRSTGLYQDYFYAVGQYGIILENKGLETEFEIKYDKFWHWIQAIEFADDQIGWAAGGDPGWGNTTDGMVLHTTDAGETWNAQLVTNLPINDMDFINGQKGWIVGDDGMIKSTSNAGLNWGSQESKTRSDLTAVHFVDESYGWAVSRYSDIIHTSNGGNTWVKQKTYNSDITQNPLYGVFFLNRNKGFTVGLSGTILVTYDGGLAWEIVETTGLAPQRYTSIYFLDDLKGCITGINGTVLLTEDGGDTWQNIESGTHESLFSVCFLDKENGWIAGDAGTVLRTVNGGHTWFRQNTGVATNTLTSVYFTNLAQGWAVGEGGTILHTSNGGFIDNHDATYNWDVDLLIEDNKSVYDTLFIIPLKAMSKEKYLTGIELILDSVIHPSVSELEFYLEHNGVTDTLVYHVNTTGQNFFKTQLTDLAPQNISDGEAPFLGAYKPYQSLSVFKGSDPYGEWILRIYDGQSGNVGVLKSWGLKPVYGAPTIGTDVKFEKYGAIHLYQNVPNPVSSSALIQWKSTTNGKTVFKLYNIDGREMAILVNKNQPAGDYSITIDVSGFPSGIYFYKLEIEDQMQTKKMIVIR